MQQERAQSQTGASVKQRPGAALSASLRVQLSRWTLPVLLGLAVTLLYTAYSALQWDAFTVKSWDLGIFTQLAQRYAVWETPFVPIKGPNYNLLGDHFHPLLALLGPVYALFPHAFTLLVVQNALFGLATALIARGALSRLGPVRGALLGLAFGLSWGLQYAVEAQFHEIAFAVPLLAGSLVALLDRRWIAAAVWGGLLVFVKEDLGLTVIALGLVLAWRSRRRIGIALAAWGGIWFFLATKVILPALNPDGGWDYGNRFDPFALLSDPGSLFALAKGETLLLLLAVSAGLALYSPITLVALPTLGWRFLSENAGYWGPTWHYSAVLLPIVFVALLDGIERTRRPEAPRWLRGYGRAAPVVALVASLVLLPSLPLAALATPGTSFAAPRAEAARAVLEAVPAGASVESDIGLMSYLLDDHVVTWIGNDNPVPDAILIDRVSGGTPSEWGDVLGVAAELHPDERFEVLFSDSGYELARRVTG